MKKLLAIVLVIGMIATFAACDTFMEDFNEGVRKDSRTRRKYVILTERVYTHFEIQQLIEAIDTI